MIVARLFLQRSPFPLVGNGLFNLDVMFIQSKILSCFAGLVGFHGSESDDVAEIDADLQGSTSGRFVDTLHPLLTYENLLTTAQLFEAQNVRIFSAAKAYKIGQVVKEGADYYQAVTDLAASAALPSATPGSWRKTTLFSAFLRRQYEASVLNLVSAIFTEKKLNAQGKTLLASAPLFAGAGTINTGITKQGKFRGFKITLRHPDTTLILQHIGLQLTAAQNPVNIYLYHSSQVEPLEIIPLNQPNNITYKWHKLPVERLLTYSDLDTHTGGSYYIGYYEEDLTGQAIERKNLPHETWSGNECSTCTNVVENFRYWKNYREYVNIRSFYVDAVDLFEDFGLWDPDDENFESGVSYGLNMQFAIQCDVSSALCLNAPVLAEALAQQLKVDFLTGMSYGLRDNQKMERIAQLAASALDDRGDGQAKTPGEITRLNKIKNAVSIDFSKLSSVCLPCMNKRYTQKTVWR